MLSIKTTKAKNEILDFGKQLAMQVAASSPLAIDKESLDQNILQKEKEIITEELKNTGKDTKIVEKIAIGKLNKFISIPNGITFASTLQDQHPPYLRHLKR